MSDPIFGFRTLSLTLPSVEKAIYDERYRSLCRSLKARRVYLGLHQTELAERLGSSQSVVSSYEKGERRLDIVELDQICTVLELSLVDVVAEYERLA